MTRIIRGVVFVGFACLLAACVQTTAKQAPAASFHFSSAEQKRIAVIEPDVVLGELTASGMFEPRADWTGSAKSIIANGLKSEFGQRGIDVVYVDELTDLHHMQIARLHGVVGLAIVRHLYVPENKLPNKGTALDWTLGPGANAIREAYDADYALFIYVRDSYSTSGRVALMIGAALLGVGVSGGHQSAFASLVDMRTGNIVWFNVLQSATGDLRTASSAQSTIAGLVKDIPL